MNRLLADCMLVVFSAAQSFLGNGDLVIHQKLLRMSMAPDPRVIVIENVPKSLKEEMELILENKREGGGPICTFTTTDDLKAVVTFGDETGMHSHAIGPVVSSSSMYTTLVEDNERMHYVGVGAAARPVPEKLIYDQIYRQRVFPFRQPCIMTHHQVHK